MKTCRSVRMSTIMQYVTPKFASFIFKSLTVIPVVVRFRKWLVAEPPGISDSSHALKAYPGHGLFQLFSLFCVAASCADTCSAGYRAIRSSYFSYPSSFVGPIIESTSHTI